MQTRKFWVSKKKENHTSNTMANYCGIQKSYTFLYIPKDQHNHESAQVNILVIYKTFS